MLHLLTNVILMTMIVVMGGRHVRVVVVMAKTMINIITLMIMMRWVTVMKRRWW